MQENQIMKNNDLCWTAFLIHIFNSIETNKKRCQKMIAVMIFLH